MDISIPLFQEHLPGRCPRHKGKKGAYGGTLWPGKPGRLWGHWASIQADLQHKKNKLGSVKLQREHRTRCYSHPVQRLAQLPGAALLAPLRCDPSAMQSTGEPYHPANKMRLLMRLPHWDPMLPGILLPKSAYWNGHISIPQLNPTSQTDIHSVAAMELGVSSQNCSSCGVEPPLVDFSWLVDLKWALLYEHLKPSLAYQLCLKYIRKFEMWRLMLSCRVWTPGSWMWQKIQANLSTRGQILQVGLCIYGVEVVCRS